MGKPALMQPQLGTHHDDGTAGIVNAFSEQVLAEPALLAAQHVAQGFERALVGTGDGLAAPSVIEQHVDRFLQHAFFVPDDDVRGVQLHQPFQTVVAVDHPAVQVVEVRRGEPAAFQGNQRPAGPEAAPG